MEEPAVGSQSGLFLLLKPGGRAAMFELSCSASCNRASKSSIFSERLSVGQDEMPKSMKTYLLLHPNYASPLLNEKAITLLPEIRLEVGLQGIGICAYRKIDQTYKFRIFLELLEGLREAGALEIVEDRLVTVQC